MTEIRVESLASDHDEDHRTQREKAGRPLVREEEDGSRRVQRSEDAGTAGDLGCTEHADRGEPHQHDRTEHAADRSRASPISGRTASGQLAMRRCEDVIRWAESEEARGRDQFIDRQVSR